jgi:hypothetical protein
MLVMVTPLARLTCTATLLLVFVPLPNWPKSLSPQAQTVPAGEAASTATAGTANVPEDIAINVITRIKAKTLRIVTQVI